MNNISSKIKINKSYAPIRVFCIISLIILVCYILNIIFNLTINTQNKRIIPTKNIKIKSFESTIFPFHKKNIYYKIKTPVLNINQTTRQATLKQPIITLYNTHSATWNISANKAIALINGSDWRSIKQITLLNNVHIKQIVRPTLARLTTTKLEFYPQTSIVRTEKPVVIKKNKSKTTGIGLFASLKQKSIHLLKHVHTQYFIN